MANQYIDKIKFGPDSQDYDFKVTGTSGAKNVTTAEKAEKSNAAPGAVKADAANTLNNSYYVATNTNISATKLYASALSGDANGKVTWTMNLSAVPWDAISSTDASKGAQNNATTANWKAVASSNSGFVTPKNAKDYIDANTSGITAGIYQVKGNSTSANLTNTTAHVVGYVFNMSESGKIPTSSGYNGQTFQFQKGDNLVWLSDGSNAGWDKLADSMSAAMSTLKLWSAASADWKHFDDTSATVATYTAASAASAATGWYNSAHSAFANVAWTKVDAGTTGYNSTASTDIFTITGNSYVSVTGSNSTASISFTGWSGFKAISANTVEGTALTANKSTAGSLGANLAINTANNSNLTFTTTVDSNGRPLIKIDKTNTTAIKATSTKFGGVQKTYYKETDGTNHIGCAVIQGNMSATTWS